MVLFERDPPSSWQTRLPPRRYRFIPGRSLLSRPNRIPEPETVPPPPLSSLLTRRVCTTILNYALLSLLDISLVALSPIVFASPVAVGGLGMQPATIGLVLALQGIVTGAATALLVPRMQRWFGMRMTYRCGVWLYLGQIWLFPAMHYAVKLNLGGGMGVWVLIGLYTIISCASPISFLLALQGIVTGAATALRMQRWHANDLSMRRMALPGTDLAVPRDALCGQAEPGRWDGRMGTDWVIYYYFVCLADQFLLSAPLYFSRVAESAMLGCNQWAGSDFGLCYARDWPGSRDLTFCAFGQFRVLFGLHQPIGSHCALYWHQYADARRLDCGHSIVSVIILRSRWAQSPLEHLVQLIDPNNGVTRPGSLRSFDSSESESDVVETPASDSAADAQIKLAENDNNLQHGAYPSPETALANLACTSCSLSRRVVTSLQRFAHIRPETDAAELSHDMITTYPDASDEGRVKPIRSILLSNVKDIDPYDPTQPTRVRMHMSVLGLDVSADVEYDTEESAHEWRREVSAALYMYRHHRKTLIGHGNEKVSPRPEDAQTESRGVRICIPLALIKEYQHEWWAAWAFILSVAVDHRSSSGGIRDIVPSGSLDSAVKSVLRAVAPLESDMGQLAQSVMPKSTKRESFTGLSLPCSHTPSLSPTTTVSTDSSSVREPIASVYVPPSPSPWLQTTPSGPEPEGLAQVLHLSVLQGDDRWNQFDNLVKARRENGVPPNAQVVLDWGELVFDEHTGSESGSDSTREMKVEAPAFNEMSSAERKIRRLFAIDDQQKVWIARCRLCKTISSTTYFVITDRFVCYWAKSFGTHDTRYRFPVSSVRGASTAYVYAPLVYGLRLQIRGQHDLTFEFNSRELRDEALTKLKAIADTNLASENGPIATTGSEVPSPRAEHPSPITIPEFSSTQECVSNAPALFSPLSRTMRRINSVHIPPALVSRFPKPINVPPTAIVHIPSKHFVCLTIGSRGDVQPYIALARGLMAEGHRVTIVTHEEYKEWCEGWGLSVENRMFSPQFFKEGLTNFRDWLDDLLLDSWKQCQDADVLIQSPSAMAGAHIAEALSKFRPLPEYYSTMPWTRTNDYPHAFMTPPMEISGSFNYSTINRWRRKHLGLPSTDMAHLAQTKIPFIYNFSPAVVPKPLDWKDPITISGYWFLDDADLNWEPTQELTDFMNKARKDNKPLVYIGFGSIVVPNPKAMTRSIVKAVLKSDVRAILSKGWSARMSKEIGPEVELPPEVFSVDKIPHDWLFPKIDAALHHGGAGTTGASLRAGIPTLIKPWFGRAVSDRIMKEKAAAVGEKIRSENGVANAIRAIYTYLPRAAQDRTTL
ncbi:glycosyltransferase family 1 protein [Rhizoctonia solani]|uniref:Glycosyltransferase family 1 protein n=1 Tax=Rhizoctonia solani TaxID=456999 RepID=A0A8H8T1Z3_9AGAM|nr:glycosyltransferase family 1 protein [Rhizoctonia solani]QRW25287.1 glycosyltransferase family 1 protein [Rhizoctonia solani]